MVHVHFHVKVQLILVDHEKCDTQSNFELQHGFLNAEQRLTKRSFPDHSFEPRQVIKTCLMLV